MELSYLLNELITNIKNAPIDSMRVFIYNEFIKLINLYISKLPNDEENNKIRDILIKYRNNVMSYKLGNNGYRISDNYLTIFLDNIVPEHNEEHVKTMLLYVLKERKNKL